MRPRLPRAQSANTMRAVIETNVLLSGLRQLAEVIVPPPLPPT